MFLVGMRAKILGTKTVLRSQMSALSTMKWWLQNKPAHSEQF